MIIITVDSVTADLEKKTRSILSSMDNIVSINAEPKYDDISSIVSCVSDFFQIINENKNSNYVFPVSLLALYNTEMFDVVLRLVESICKRFHIKHVSILIDGDENIALEEIIDERYKILLSLEDLKQRKRFIDGTDKLRPIFSDDIIIIKTSDPRDICQMTNFKLLKNDVNRQDYL
jgi:hypothetical protein